jgi:hypothetical protein
MTQPPNGTPPQLPPRSPHELPPGFSAWPTLAACLIMDRTQQELQLAAGQLVFLGQMDLAREYAGALQHLLQVRERFYRKAQGGLIVAGPGDLPKG